MLAALLATIVGAGAAAPYAAMAPIGQYLISDRQAEMALARRAAPAALSQHATVLVLTAHGYETAARGSNGFTCLVERSWDSPFDSADFWNWHLRGPDCFNPAASRTALSFVFLRTKLALAGLSKSQMLDRIKAAVAANELPGPALGAMAYMMSKQQYLTDGAKAWVPHLMFFTPKSDLATNGASWGANLQNSPVVFDSVHHVVPEPFAILMIPVGTWSDGSPADLSKV